ncbi:hypothetical protein BKI52_37715 [marine bacterium AO1-C]|nr:hypothetical protein BKI52_37715 [marine bacterium AO1-C]
MIDLLTTKVEPQNSNFFRTTQWVYLIGLFGHSFAGLAFWISGINELALFNGVISVPAFSVAFMVNRQGRHVLAFAFAFFELFFHQVLAVYYLGWETGAQYWFIYLAGLSFFNPFWNYKVQISLLLLTMAGFIGSYIFNYEGIYHLPPRAVSFSFYSNSVTAVMLSAFLINSYSRAAQRAEERLKGVIGELSEKNEEIATQQDNILQSINYAKTIQTAVIPDSRELARHFNEYFVLFEPASIVSGDFYWFSETKENIVVVCADCTGHGVPGGFMSMLGISFLNELVNNQKITAPAQILNELRAKVKNALQNNHQEDQPQDGMDMSICVFDKQKSTLTFAGANNGIFLLRNEDITEYKPNKNPIGSYPKEMPFEQILIDLKPKDRVYLYTDGYIDQFGGNDDKKFMKRQLKEKLIASHQLSLEQQGQQLESIFKTWRGKQEQIDDCTLIGLLV